MNLNLTSAQLTALANARTPHSELVWLFGPVGLQWGEAFTHRPPDLDLLRKGIHVNRTAAKLGTKIMLYTSKSHEKRSVAVSKSVTMEVAKYRGREEFLLPSRTGAPLIAPKNNSWVDQAVKRCQTSDSSFPRATTHGNRHVAARLLNKACASVKVV